MGRLIGVALVVVALIAGGIGYWAGASHVLTPTDAIAADECQTFSQTGKMVCGRFLEYWLLNGGLAQQGLPLSDSFQERSDVDGKTYTVQYFERAVFEAHPENQRPYDVLLSLLGGEKYKAKYPNGPSGAPASSASPAPSPPSTKPQQLAGNGTQAPTITLAEGLTLVDLHYSGSANFIVQLLDKNAKLVDLLANEIGSYDGQTAVRVPGAGTYTVAVKSTGNWTIALTQPGPADFSQNAAPPQTYQNRGAHYTPYLAATAGALHITARHNGQRNFIVRLLDTQGRLVDLVANEIGAYEGTTVTNIPASGAYLFVVDADGDWTIEVK